MALMIACHWLIHKMRSIKENLLKSFSNPSPLHCGNVFLGIKTILIGVIAHWCYCIISRPVETAITSMTRTNIKLLSSTIFLPSSVSYKLL